MRCEIVGGRRETRPVPAWRVTRSSGMMQTHGCETSVARWAGYTGLTRGDDGEGEGGARGSVPEHREGDADLPHDAGARRFPEGRGLGKGPRSHGLREPNARRRADLVRP